MYISDEQLQSTFSNVKTIAKKIYKIILEFYEISDSGKEPTNEFIEESYLKIQKLFNTELGEGVVNVKLQSDVPGQLILHGCDTKSTFFVAGLNFVLMELDKQNKL